jgi:hypothetical protein
MNDGEFPMNGGLNQPQCGPEDAGIKRTPVSIDGAGVAVKTGITHIEIADTVRIHIIASVPSVNGAQSNNYD